jgi:phage gp46-like protein
MDIKLTKLNDGTYDITFTNGSFTITDTLETAFLMSVFGEVRAAPDQVAPPEFRRGWLGNELSKIPQYQIGSLLWLLSQSPLTPRVLQVAEDYTTQSLQWLIDDNIVSKIDVKASMLDNNKGIHVVCNIIKIDNSVESFSADLYNNTFK